MWRTVSRTKLGHYPTLSDDGHEDPSHFLSQSNSPSLYKSSLTYSLYSDRVLPLTSFSYWVTVLYLFSLVLVEPVPFISGVAQALSYWECFNCILKKRLTTVCETSTIHSKITQFLCWRRNQNKRTYVCL